MNRILAPVTLDEAEISQLVGKLGLTQLGTAHQPKEGRIATNYIIRTHEHGKLVLRLYPSHYGLANVQFEIETLNWFHAQELLVPVPLRFEDGLQCLDMVHYYAMAYIALPGQSLEQKALDVQYAQKSGEMLSRLIQASVLFKPSASARTRSFATSLTSLYESFPIDSQVQRVHEDLLTAMKNTLTDTRHLDWLHNTELGITHYDYFFENILVDNGEVVGIIDFGDACYGHPVNDLAIGVMEFSVDSQSRWRMDWFKAFLKANDAWISHFEVDSSRLIWLMRCHCVYFALQTLTEPLDDASAFSANAYVNRFMELGDPGLVKMISDFFEDQKNMLKEKKNE